jgi:hypothetical protein
MVLGAQLLQRQIGLDRLAEKIALPIIAAHFLRSRRGRLGLDELVKR